MFPAVDSRAHRGAGALLAAVLQVFDGTFYSSASLALSQGYLDLRKGQAYSFRYM